MINYSGVTHKPAGAPPCRKATHAPRPWLQPSRILSALLSFTLAGCVVGPDYRAPQLQILQSFKNQAALETAGPRSSAPPLDSWWTGFRDPELVRIIERVLAQNLDLAASQARIQQAQAVAQGAGARQMPQGSVDAGVTRQHQSLESPLGKIASSFPGYRRDQTLEIFGAAASWELDLAGGLKRRTEAARDSAQVAEAMQTGLRISVAAEAADAYFRVRGAKERIDLIESQVKTVASQVELVGKRVAYGVSDKREMAHSEARLAQVRSRLAPLHTELEVQMNRLEVLMGATPGTYQSELQGVQTQYVIPGINTGAGPGELLRRRPDVIAAERRLAVSNALIGLAISEYYPKVSLSALLGFESLRSAAMFTPASFQPAAVAGLHWRLFDFGLVDAEVAQAKGAKEEALANYRQAMLRATEDVENAITVFVQIGVQKYELENETKARGKACAAAQDEFKAGAVDLLEVLDEDQKLSVAAEELASAHANEARAAVAVFRAFGGGWTPMETGLRPRERTLPDGLHVHSGPKPR